MWPRSNSDTDTMLERKHFLKLVVFSRLENTTFYQKKSVTSAERTEDELEG